MLADYASKEYTARLDVKPGPSMLALLGVGGGIAGMAGIGSALSLAGFGFEHILMTAVGLAGSALGGLLGGGALGLGALGTMGVGMGSDILVAKDAMKEMTTQTQAFVAVWDKVTKGAKATFINNVAMPIMSVAQGYLPLIAAAAQRNFTIIGNSIKPLLAFLSGPGHKIFQDLENVFARDLPIGVGIFTQALELLLKTIDHIATTQNFGSFLQRVLDFVTRLNTTGFDHLMGQVDSMIKLFHVWATFIAVLGRDIFDMFAMTVGLGSSIIVTLTGMLQKLGEWERSTQGKAAMHNLFEAHKQEVLELLQLLPLLVKTVGPIYLQLATVFTQLAVPIIALVLHVVEFLTHLGGGVGQVMSFAIGLALIETRLRAITITMRLVQATIAIFTAMRVAALALASGMTAEEFAANAAAAGITRTGLAMVILQARTIAVTIATRAAAVATAIWTAIMDANPISLIIIGLAALAVALVLIVTHWKQVSTAVADAWNRYSLLRTIILMLLGPIGVLINVLIVVVSRWQQITTAVGNAYNGLKGLIGIIGSVIGWLSNLGHAAQAAGALLNFLNPFAHHSPSLVEQVAAGTVAIGRYYGSLATQIGAHASRAKGYMSGFSPNAVNGNLGLIRPGSGGMALAGAGGMVINMPVNVSVIGSAANNPQQAGSAVAKEVSRQLSAVIKGLKGGSYLPGQGLPT